MIYIGTSGYSFRDWVGPFYPKGTRSSDMLAQYARHFPAVEINATYYKLPGPQTFASMQAKTPSRFRFIVKFPAAITHKREGHLADFDAFMHAVQPLEDAGKFHGALAQFPWAFRNTPENRDYLRLLRVGYPQRPLFVEFRHVSWARPETSALLRDLDTGFCVVDEPRLPTLFPSIVEVTGDTGYIRFHGRNAAKWWEGDNHTRYDYLYSDEELREWIGKIRDMSSRTKDLFVFFNNCHGGQAAQNAKHMMEMLRLEL